MTDQHKIVSIDIAAAFGPASAYLSDPRNLTEWAPNFARAIALEGDHWRVTMDEGEVRARFAPPNAFGIGDHWVTMPDGSEVYNPMRLVASPTGCLLCFVVFRQPGFSDPDLARDADRVLADLVRLKRILEDRAT